MDYVLFQAINRLSGKNPFLDRVMILASRKIRYLFLFVLIYLLIRDRYQDKAAKNPLISVVIAWVFHFIVKIFYFKPRPFIYRRVGILIPSKNDSSFPSKHTVLVFAISTSILFREKIVGKILCFLSFLTGFSRIWVGHHYPSDIVLSALAGSLISLSVELHSRIRNLFVHE